MTHHTAPVRPQATALASATAAFAAALLLLGPAAAHPQAGPVTDLLLALVLLAGFVQLLVAVRR